MPPRKTCSSEMKKQKQIIDNRLLEISILVEDYIYEDKPIRRSEAETYAKEVASYADKCLGDKRSLQVIEKLMRHMRGIIAEQGETVDENIFAQPLPGNTPVYSGLDDYLKPYKHVMAVEDLTQEFSSIEEPIKNGINKRKAAIKRNIGVHSGLDDDMTQCTQVTEFEDLNQEFISTNCVEEPVKISRKKRKAIVKRNIRHNSGLDDDLTQCTQDIEFEDFTQEFSSLKKSGNKTKAIKGNMRKSYFLDDDMTQCTKNADINFVEKPNNRPRNIRNAVVKQNITKTKVKRNISDTHSSKLLDVINLCDNDDDDKNTGCNNSLDRIEESLENPISSSNIPNTPASFSVCSPSILTSFDAVPGITKSKKQEGTEKLNTGENIYTENNIDKSTKTLISENIEMINEFNDGKTPKEPFSIKDIAKENINNMKRHHINKQIYTQMNDIKHLKHYKPINVLNAQKTSANTVEISKYKVNKVYSNVNTKGCIYNDKVVNDLSWIENIRYIREIANKEYENVLIPDNFWDNYTLPDKWNDDDFLYA